MARWNPRALVRLALPLVVGVAVVSAAHLAVAPLGDAIAGAIASAAGPSASAIAAAPLPPGPPPPASPSDLADADEEAFAPRRIASRMPTPRRTGVEDAKDAGTVRAPAPDAPKATIVVPASAVTRAMEKRDVSAANATAPDGTPLGARLAGVSRYRTGLRDGDIVISVGGTRTATVEALVAAGMSAAGGGASRITGRILRGDTTYAVVLELPTARRAEATAR